MKRRLSTFFLICLVLLFASLLNMLPTRLYAQDENLNVTAQLQDAAGSVVGSVSLTQSGDRVWVVAQVNNLPPGFHAIKIHSVGNCDTGDRPFSGASGPLSADAGELPTLLVLADGSGYITTVTDRFRVADLLDENGSSVIVYENEAGAGIACGILQNLESADALAANLAAMQQLPLDQLPAAVSRGEGAERGTLVMTLHALGGAQVQTIVESGAAGQIGSVVRDGDFYLFTFTEITYNVAPIQLLGGFSIGAQTIRLDPSQTSTMRVNINTGEIFRDFHWILTATDVLYDGQDSITLGDTAAARIAEVRNLGNNVYSVRLLTHWSAAISLETWTINGTTLPSGDIDSTAEFDGVYILDFNH